jgi:hypothetical protein
MRPKYVVFAAALSVGVASSAWSGDEPAPPAAAPAAQPAPATQAAPGNSTAAAAKTPAKDAATAASKDSDADAQEKHLLARGYKKETHNGQIVYCRKEIKFGSRFETKQCGSAQDMELAEQQARDLMNNNRISGGTRNN